MARPLWPPELPKILRDGYSDRRIDQRTWPNRESGGAPRLSGSANLREIQGFLWMPHIWQRFRLERFFEEEISRGAKSFIIADPIRHSIPVLTSGGVPALTHDGTPILLSCWRRARFAPGGIEWSVVGVIHRASFTLLIYDK